MKPTLRQLQYLVAVADTGRFGAAAKKMNVSQPSLSAQIAEAEAFLGAELLERGRRGAFLTPAGREVVRRARIILAEAEDLKTAATTGGTLAGRIRLGVLPSVGPYFLPRAVRGVHEAYPDLRLAISEGDTRTLEIGLREGQLDAVVSTPEDHAGESAPLFTERLWAAMAPDDPLAKKPGPVSLSALAGRNLLTLSRGYRFATLIHTLAAEAGARISDEYEGSSLDAIRLMAATGAGIAILPNLYASTEARRGDDIAMRLIDDPRAQRSISLIWRTDSPLEQGFQAMSAALREAAEAIIASGDAP